MIRFLTILVLLLALVLGLMLAFERFQRLTISVATTPQEAPHDR